MRTEFERRLSHSMQDNVKEINEDAWKNLLYFAKEEINRKRSEHRIGFGEFWIRQIKYLSCPIWLIQGIVLVALLVLLKHAYVNLSLNNSKQIAGLLCVSGMLVMLTVIPTVKRSLMYRINETEAGTRFSVRKLLLAKVLMIATGDCIMILGLLLLTIKYTSMSCLQTMLLLLVPFLTVSGLMLFVLSHVRIEKFAIDSISLSTVLSGCFMALIEHFPFVLERKCQAGWIGIGIFLLGFCVRQIVYIVTCPAVTELQINCER